MRGDKQAQGASGQANSNANAEFGNAQSLYSTLTPQLEAQAANPSGYGPTDLAAMDTEAQQTAGGSEAGAVGQGALLAARTRNAGAAGKAISDSTRAAGEELSKGRLGVSVGNAKLKNQQREQALGELGGLTENQYGAANNSLGEVANNVNANTNASNASWNWAKYLLDPALEAGGKAGAAYAGAH